MTQVTDSPNTIPVDFARVASTVPGGIHRETILAQRHTFRFVAAQITAAHREFIERIQRLPPNEIDPRLQADAEDLETRAEVLRCHMLAMKDYVDEFLRDTAGLSWSVNLDRKYIEASFRDLINDVVGQISIGAESERQESSWRAA